MRKSSYTLTLIITVLTGLLMAGVAGCGDDNNPISSDQTPPTVNSNTIPADDATNVSLNTTVAASFSEDMNASTVSASTFTLKRGVTVVAGAVTYFDGPGATFIPAVPLLANTVYTVTIGTGAEDLAGNGLATDFVWTFTTGSLLDVVRPLVVSTAPQDGAANVAINTTITATFSESLNPATINSATFLLKQGTTAKAGTVTYSGNTATFTPSVVLANSTEYTVTITSGVADLAGNFVSPAKVWAFRTASATDIARPSVVSVIPANTASAISVSANLSATFSEAMNAATISTSTFLLAQGATPVSGVVSYAGGIATFNPSSNLSINTSYTATITAAASDLSGNAMLAPYVWTFTTSATPDQTPPTVATTFPANGANNVSTNVDVVANFSEIMNAPTLSPSTVRLMQGAVQYDGLVTYHGNTMTFNPASELAPGATFTVTILTGATDLAGNALASNYVWTFTTAPVVPPVDVTPPTVLVTAPLNSATSVATSVNLTVGFSEKLAPLTVSGSTFTLKQGATPVAGVVTYSGTTASFDPSSPLAAQTVYTATITNGVADVAGNAMTANYVWTFTTVGGVNPDAPSVVSVTPEDEAIDVATVANITATFSEGMNPATITTSTFTLIDKDGAVPGSVTYSGTTATFNPSTSLDPSSVYAATISTGATDASGVALATEYTWIFLTEAVPEMAATEPRSFSLNIAINAKVAISFDKPMDPATLNTSTFTVRNGATVIAGTVSAAGVTAVFDPTANLSPNTEYTVTVSAAATDVSGNPLASPIVWTFTTGSEVDVTSPVVTDMYPANGVTNVARDATVRAFFNDAMDPSTLTAATFTLTSSSGAGVGEVTYSETVAYFTPSVLFAPNTVYTVTIASAVADISGNTVGVPTVWSFTTGN